MRTVQAGEIDKCLAMARADRRAAYKQLPVLGARKMRATATLRDQQAGEMRGSTPTDPVVWRRSCVPPLRRSIPAYSSYGGKMVADL